MSEPGLVGQVVMEYLDKFPNTSSLCIARILYRDNVELFADVEHARSAIRYYRGAMGEKNRNDLATRRYVRKFKTTEHEPI